MPKRTREDTIIATAPVKAPVPALSAFAQRQLRSQQASAASMASTAQDSASNSPGPTIITPRKRKVEVQVVIEVERKGGNKRTGSNGQFTPASDARKERQERRNGRGDAKETPVRGRGGEDTESGTPPSATKLGRPRSALEMRRELLEERAMGGSPNGRGMDSDRMDIDEGESAGKGEGEGKDEDDMEIIVAHVGKRPTTTSATAQQISTFAPTLLNHEKREQGGVCVSIFRLKHHETLTVQGIYTLRIKSGSISIYGATLTPESSTLNSNEYTIFAPLTHALPVIECLASPKTARRKGEFDAEIELRSHDPGFKDLGKIVPAMGGIWSLSGSRGGGTGANSVAVGAAERDTTFNPIYTSCTPLPPLLAIPPCWKSTLQNIKSILSTNSTPTLPTILITGSKSTGKSTLSRILTNALLTQHPPTPSSSSPHTIFYLDLDPGQPEFSPPGLISLNRLTLPILGPSFTHPSLHGPHNTRIKTHHIGYTSPKDDPGYYISCVADLLNKYREMLAEMESASSDSDSPQTPPLIINTMGWIKSTGLEILNDILNLSSPTDVIFCQSQNPSSEKANPIHALLSPSTRFYTLDFPPSSEAASIATGGSTARYTPHDLRTLQLSSYLHHKYTPQGNITWDFSTPLVAIRPWVVPYTSTSPSKDDRAIHAITILHCAPLPISEVPNAIEGTLVGITLYPPLSSSSASKDFPPLPPGGTTELGLELPYIPEGIPGPAPLGTPGLALVRSIDCSSGSLHVLLFGDISPQDLAFWEKENYRIVLVRGRLELGVGEMLGAGIGMGEGEEGGVGGGGGGVPWLSFGKREERRGEGVRGGGREWRVRRNLMRRGLGG